MLFIPYVELTLVYENMIAILLKTMDDGEDFALYPGGFAMTMYRAKVEKIDFEGWFNSLA
jgi:hypothetical protein